MDQQDIDQLGKAIAAQIASLLRPKGKKRYQSEPDKEAYSIQDFCRAHGISRGTYYNLKKAGRAPATVGVGQRILITKKAAEEWLVLQSRPATNANGWVEHETWETVAGPAWD